MSYIINEPAKKRKTQIFSLKCLPIEMKQKIINFRYADYKCSNTIKAHNGAVNCIIIHENFIISCGNSNDTTIKVWNLENLKLIKVLKGHQKQIYTLKSYKKNILSNSQDNTIKIWDLEKGICIRTINIKRSIFNKIYKFSIIDKFIVSTFQAQRENNNWISRVRNVIQLWDINTGNIFKIFNINSNSNHIYNTNSIKILGNKYIIITNSSIVEIWNIIINKCVKILKEHNDDVLTWFIWKFFNKWF